MDCRTRFILIPLSLSLAIFTTACSAKEMPEYKLNLNPKRAYEITLTISDAPGTFQSIQSLASYVAPNCQYTVNKFEGVVSNPNKSVPLAFKKISDSAYVSTLYLDAMLDEDYFDTGVC